MKRINKYITVGLLAGSTAIILKHTIGENIYSEFIMGSSLPLLLLGLLAEKLDLSRIMSFKFKLVGAK